jgi:SAM-dependent methyltransferase
VENNLDEFYWSERYKNLNTQWDIGRVSPPLRAYFNQLTDKSARILIPGCGRAYEAEYLHKAGFVNVFIADFSEWPLRDFLARVPSFPEEHLMHVDFFKIEEKFDLIIEQTMFCAIDPSLRQNYAQKCKDILQENGKLVGLFFEKTFEGGPPFGGSMYEYQTLFSKSFKNVDFKPCYNSIAPRQGSELFAKIN